MKTSFKYIYIVIASISLVCCDEHKDFPDTSVRVGDVLCTDGRILSYEKYIDSNLDAIGVVFNVNHSQDTPDKAYAVYLQDLPALQFCDTLGTTQGTSASLTAYDGNSNTYKLYSQKEAQSPMADYVFDMWKFGQSAYIPSVAQLQALYVAKSEVNKTLENLGGEMLSDQADEAWYWSSTEVEGQESDKAWLFSISTGALQETPKDQSHRIRPVVTIYND